MGNYPRQLNLDHDVEVRLVSYIYDELVRHYFERQPAIDELMDLQADYIAEPDLKVKNFPFTKAANIVIPLTAIAIEAVHARVMTTMYSVSPFVTIKTRVADFEKNDSDMENWFEYELLHTVKIRKPLGDMVLEAEKFGTMIGKSGYEKIVKKAVRERLDGTEEEFPVLIKDGATLDCVPQANFLFPYTYKDAQVDPWVGEEHSRVPYQVKLMEEAGFFYPGTYAKLLPYVQQATIGVQPSLGRRYERFQEKEENRESHWPRRIDWVELWLAFDVDGDGREEELVVHYHPQAKMLMSVRYNWHEDLHRPYRTGVYMPVENRWRGIGIGKQNRQFQLEVTTQHRQRLDNATIANMNMIKVHKLSGYGPREPIFPGKMWLVDDMTHVESFKLGEVYQSSFTNEQATLIYSQQRTGVNEVTLGMPQVGTPGTATSDLTRMQEGGIKFDFYLDNIKKFTNELLLDVLCNIAQFGPKNVSYFDTVTGGDFIRRVLTMPLPLLRQSILFEVGAAGKQSNRLLDRQNWTQIAQLLTQYYQSMMLLAGQDQQMLSIIQKKGITAATEAMRQILESFDIRNIDRLLVTELEDMIQNASAPSGNGFNGGGVNRIAGNGNPQSLMEFFTKIAPMLRGAGTPQTPSLQ